MAKTPDYENYTDAQLQDALEHVDREHYPANFAALQDEIHRRPIHLPAPPNGGGNVSWFYGWLSGIVVGLVVGQIVFLIWAEYLKSTGTNPYGHDDWSYGWVGVIVLSVLICSFMGFIIGLWPRNRK